MRFAKFYEIWNLKLLNFIEFYLRDLRLLERRKVMRAGYAPFTNLGLRKALRRDIRFADQSARRAILNPRAVCVRIITKL